MMCCLHNPSEFYNTVLKVMFLSLCKQAVNKRKGKFTWVDENTLELFVVHIGNTLAKSQLHETALYENPEIPALACKCKTRSMNLTLLLVNIMLRFHTVLSPSYVLHWLSYASSYNFILVVKYKVKYLGPTSYAHTAVQAYNTNWFNESWCFACFIHI